MCSKSCLEKSWFGKKLPHLDLCTNLSVIENILKDLKYSKHPGIKVHEEIVEFDEWCSMNGVSEKCMCIVSVHMVAQTHKE